jgi:hypothetical protein
MLSFFRSVWPYLVILLLSIILFWSYKEIQSQTAEKLRYKNNMLELHNGQQSGYTHQNLTVDELKNYIHINNKNLVDSIVKNHIRLNRVQKIYGNKTIYSDLNNRAINIDSFKNFLIKNPSVNREQVFVDSSKCLVIRGKIISDSTGARIEIDDRKYKGESYAIIYWERKPWTFLGIRSRIFGTKQFTSKTFSECGDVKSTELIVIPK